MLESVPIITTVLAGKVQVRYWYGHAAGATQYWCDGISIMKDDASIATFCPKCLPRSVPDMTR